MVAVMDSTSEMSSGQDPSDLRNRLKEVQLLETMKSRLIEDILGSLDAVKEKLSEESKKRKRDLFDLESEKESRRQLQEKVAKLKANLTSMEHGRFVLVLIDADARNSLFRDEYLAHGVQGGQAAAESFMDKVREHLVDELGASKEKTKTIPIMVKAYANLKGLAEFCVKDQRLRSTDDLTKFWIGFTRGAPLVDFVDVGSGKEEVDSKLRQVLAFHVNNPQCTQIMLVCCHDAGYVPVLRPYSTQSLLSQKITLVSTGGIYPAMANLGFRSTAIFETLFSAVRTGSPRVSQSRVFQSLFLTGQSSEQALISTQQHRPSVDHDQISPTNTNPQRTPSFVLPSPTIAGQPSPTILQLKYDGIPQPFGPEVLVANADRLGPVLRNSAGQRVDKKLHIQPHILRKMKNQNICSWHYLRSNHNVTNCKRSHDSYARPLSDEEYDSLWFLSRFGYCNRLKKTGNCDDALCIYGHGLVES